ncbi:MAG TPA: hypothetical protein VMV90_16140 [Rectinemataceae bacterium]|nr:hypothetical protein [Rectinemataceae bacterium]
MRRRGALVAAALLTALFLSALPCARLAAQEASVAGTPAAAPSAAAPTGTGASSAVGASPSALPPGFGQTEAKPENPWRRFEIVSIGAFPISLFYMSFGFDLGGYVGSGFDSRYAPWPFQNSSSVLPTDSQRLGRIGAAVGLSLVIGGIDAIIHQAKLKAEARREAAKSVELDSGGAGD